MEELTDVVYPIGSGSGWRNNELRFSLRALEHYGIHLGKIFIVGILPDFLDNSILNLPVKDIYNPCLNADGNIIHKVLCACEDDRLSEDFLFINDDHILLRSMELKDIPNFHKGDMNLFPETYWLNNIWRKRLNKTREILNLHGLPANHYDCHTPIMFNKSKFKRIMQNFNYQEGNGFTMKSLYGNSVCASKNQLLGIEKKTVFTPLSGPQIDLRLSDSQFLAFNDQGLNESLKIWLYKRFPINSKWEINGFEDRNFEIIKWMESGKEYLAGVKIFEKYFKNVNLIKIFNEGTTDYLRKKLEYKLINSLNEQWKNVS